MPGPAASAAGTPPRDPPALAVAPGRPAGDGGSASPAPAADTRPVWSRARRVRAGGVDWHVAHAPGPGQGAPVALLLHGTGASSHSWDRLAGRLAATHEVFAPDLPGHGRSRVLASRPPSLPFVADALDALMAQLQVRPDLVVGHSAGAAVGAMLCLAGHVRPRALVSINGALLPLQGPVGRMFSPLAKLLVLNPLVPAAFAWSASWDGAAERLLAGTGSRLDSEAVEAYRALITDPAHAAGALRMMAAWDLRDLERRLPTLPVPLVLLVADGDLTVPPSHGGRIAARVPGATLRRLPGLGHLAHEEDPDAVMRLLASLGLLADERAAPPAASGALTPPSAGVYTG